MTQIVGSPVRESAQIQAASSQSPTVNAYRDIINKQLQQIERFKVVITTYGDRIRYLREELDSRGVDSGSGDGYYRADELERDFTLLLAAANAAVGANYERSYIGELCAALSAFSSNARPEDGDVSASASPRGAREQYSPVKSDCSPLNCTGNVNVRDLRDSGAEEEVTELREYLSKAETALKQARAAQAAQKTAFGVQIAQMREIHRQQLETLQEKAEAHSRPQARAASNQLEMEETAARIRELLYANAVLRDANQCLQTENLVCMAKLSGQPMEVAVAALTAAGTISAQNVQSAPEPSAEYAKVPTNHEARMKTALRADPDIYRYYAKYADAAQIKKARIDAERALAAIQQQQAANQARSYNVLNPTGTQGLSDLAGTAVKRAQKQQFTVQVSPDAAVREAVIELERDFARHGAELHIDWRRIDTQSAKSDSYSWHIAGKPVNLVLARGKLFVEFGATRVLATDYISKCFE